MTGYNVIRRFNLSCAIFPRRFWALQGAELTNFKFVCAYISVMKNGRCLWIVLDGDGKQKHVSGPLKPQKLLAKLKKGTYPWDGKPCPVVSWSMVGCVCWCARSAGSLSVQTTLPLRTTHASPTI